MKIEEIEDNVIKFSGDSNVYLLYEEKLLIDCGNRQDKKSLKQAIENYMPLKDIAKVIFTHLHYDHVGNVDLFTNAEVFASKRAIESFEKDPFGAVLNQDIVKLLKKIELKQVEDMHGLEVIEVPGHTKGSIALWDKSHRVLFTGDTVFERGYGRTDLPTSVPEQMAASLELLRKYQPKTICPGHDY
ncbi:MAG: MBL fold metallo-hydrolase [Candidatus Nanoarchaeia archaeon]